MKDFIPIFMDLDSSEDSDSTDSSDSSDSASPVNTPQHGAIDPAQSAASPVNTPQHGAIDPAQSAASPVNTPQHGAIDPAQSAASPVNTPQSGAIDPEEPAASHDMAPADSTLTSAMENGNGAGPGAGPGATAAVNNAEGDTLSGTGSAEQLDSEGTSAGSESGVESESGSSAILLSFRQNAGLDNSDIELMPLFHDSDSITTQNTGTSASFATAEQKSAGSITQSGASSAPNTSTNVSSATTTTWTTIATSSGALFAMNPSVNHTVNEDNGVNRRKRKEPSFRPATGPPPVNEAIIPFAFGPLVLPPAPPPIIMPRGASMVPYAHLEAVHNRLNQACGERDGYQRDVEVRAQEVRRLREKNNHVVRQNLLLKQQLGKLLGMVDKKTALIEIMRRHMEFLEVINSKVNPGTVTRDVGTECALKTALTDTTKCNTGACNTVNGDVGTDRDCALTDAGIDHVCNTGACNTVNGDKKCRVHIDNTPATATTKCTCTQDPCAKQNSLMNASEQQRKHSSSGRDSEDVTLVLIPGSTQTRTPATDAGKSSCGVDLHLTGHEALASDLEAQDALDLIVKNVIKESSTSVVLAQEENRLSEAGNKHSREIVNEENRISIGTERGSSDIDKVVLNSAPAHVHGNSGMSQPEGSADCCVYIKEPSKPVCAVAQAGTAPQSVGIGSSDACVQTDNWAHSASQSRLRSFMCCRR